MAYDVLRKLWHNSSIMKTITSTQLIIILSVSCCQAVEYERFTLYDIFPTKKQEPLLGPLVVLPGFDVWTARTGDRVTMMVHPSVKSKLLDCLHKNRIKYNVITEDVASFRYFAVNKSSTLNPSATLPQDIFSDYLNYVQMNKYLHLLAVKYPDIVQVQPFGLSFERRELCIIKISTKKSNIKKPIILIDAGIHAREWISPPMALFIINQLAENKTNRYLIQDIEWHICPLLNPDGYEYARNEFEWWRKTRSLTPDVQCLGVDGNRNFDFHWMEADSSRHPCSDLYAGEKPFSERETRALRDHVLSIKNQLKLYLTFHSYGPFFLYPWGYTRDILPSNAKELHALAERANEAQMRAGGPKYGIGSAGSIFRPASGGSDDWVMGVANVSLSYTIEMPPDDSMMSSPFIPLPENIRKFVTPFFEAVRVFGHYVAEYKHYDDRGSKRKHHSVSSTESNLLKNRRNYIHTVCLFVIEFILQCNLYGA